MVPQFKKIQKVGRSIEKSDYSLKKNQKCNNQGENIKMNQFIVYSVEKNYRSLFTRRIFWKLEYIRRAQTHGRGRVSGTDKRLRIPAATRSRRSQGMDSRASGGDGASRTPSFRPTDFGLLTSRPVKKCISGVLNHPVICHSSHRLYTSRGRDD